jgi:hypothetical protein
MKRPLACSLAAMLLASASALAGPVLPPEQYDHAFDGELIVHNNQSAGDLGRECGLIFFPVGCAHPPNTHGLNATIFLADEEWVRLVSQNKTTMAQLLRHEIAHCMAGCIPSTQIARRR